MSTETDEFIPRSKRLALRSIRLQETYDVHFRD